MSERKEPVSNKKVEKQTKPGCLQSDLQGLSRRELIYVDNAVRDEWKRRDNPLGLRDIRILPMECK